MTEEETNTNNRPVIARATSNVQNGISSTSTLEYTEGHSRNSFQPGNTYNINAEYMENNHYTRASGVGILRVMKIPTETVLTTSSQTINIGDPLTVTVNVTEQRNNTTLTTGYVTLYDGNDIVSQNYAVTGPNTQIIFTPSTLGVHTIRAIYNDTGTAYNSSTEQINVTVTKLNTTITSNWNNIRGSAGDNVIITGNLSDKYGNLSGKVIKVYEYDGSLLGNITTDTNGNYNHTYTLLENTTGQSISIVYEGDGTHNSVNHQISITILLDVNINFIGNDTLNTASPLAIDMELEDQYHLPIPDGSIGVDIYPITEVSVTVTNNGTYTNGLEYYRITTSQLTAEDITAITTGYEDIKDEYMATGFVQNVSNSNGELVLTVQRTNNHTYSQNSQWKLTYDDTTNNICKEYSFNYTGWAKTVKTVPMDVVDHEGQLWVWKMPASSITSDEISAISGNYQNISKEGNTGFVMGYMDWDGLPSLITMKNIVNPYNEQEWTLETNTSIIKFLYEFDSVADCSDSTQFSSGCWYGSGNYPPSYSSNGVVSGLYYRNWWNTPVEENTTLIVEGTRSDDNRLVPLQLDFNSKGNPNGAEEQISISKDVASYGLAVYVGRELRSNTVLNSFPASFKIIITYTHNRIIIEYNNQVHSIDITDMNPEFYYYAFGKWQQGNVTITKLAIHNLNTVTETI